MKTTACLTLFVALAACAPTLQVSHLIQYMSLPLPSGAFQMCRHTDYDQPREDNDPMKMNMAMKRTENGMAGKGGMTKPMAMPMDMSMRRETQSGEDANERTDNMMGMAKDMKPQPLSNVASREEMNSKTAMDMDENMEMLKRGPGMDGMASTDIAGAEMGKDVDMGMNTNMNRAM
ncbi:hypothetical protein BO71DRAFT_410934 [Aspergillus ellipticus CBS 707.79]|uniref:Uncharacterized protein n=1 Tax=Aspergillus ellipticus CBS 707.79 TaxID=1448320 RepID=A0A319ENI1_9EURO|nr:hypothetical protein BO71DRAFT_410934 [Aspergillus ellipticus CBS 707.79]